MAPLVEQEDALLLLQTEGSRARTGYGFVGISVSLVQALLQFLLSLVTLCVRVEKLVSAAG